VNVQGAKEMLFVHVAPSPDIDWYKHNIPRWSLDLIWTDEHSRITSSAEKTVCSTDDYEIHQVIAQVDDTYYRAIRVLGALRDGRFQPFLVVQDILPLGSADFKIEVSHVRANLITVIAKRDSHLKGIEIDLGNDPAFYLP
jgi:hypothetical protein